MVLIDHKKRIRNYGGKGIYSMYELITPLGKAIIKGESFGNILRELGSVASTLKPVFGSIMYSQIAQKALAGVQSGLNAGIEGAAHNLGKALANAGINKVQEALKIENQNAQLDARDDKIIAVENIEKNARARRGGTLAQRSMVEMKLIYANTPSGSGTGTFSKQLNKRAKLMLKQMAGAE